MFTRRITFVLGSGVIVWVAYFLYALLAVPWIEPAVSAAVAGSGDDEGGAMVSPSAAYQGLLQRLFGPTAWVLAHPKMIETDQGMLLIKDYDLIRPDTIRIHPFAMIFFPHPDVRTDPARFGEAVVLETAEAELSFDQPIDFSRSKIGNLIRGRFPGRVTIRSDQKSAAAEDDLRIETSQLQLDEQKIYSPEPVEFRLGPNFGSGRELVIRMLAKEGAKSGGRRGLNIGGLQYFELVRDVRMQFELGGDGLLPGKTPVATTPPTAEKPPAPPVRITSQGAFRFDLNEQEATFRDRVEVVRLNPGGQNDKLTCDLLAIGFEAKSQDATSATPATDAEGAGKKRIPALSARRLRAQGRPVVVQSPSTGAAARCQSLEYDLKTRRVQFDDPQRAILNHRASRIEAPRMSFDPNGNAGLGTVEAWGAGSLDTFLDPEQQQPFHAQWTRELRIRSHEGQPLVSVLGQAELRVGAMGSLQAEEIWLWLRETGAAAVPSPPGAAGMAKLTARVTPDRMLAQGNVRIASPQLTGAPERFEVWFQSPADAHVAQIEEVPADAADVPGAPGRFVSDQQRPERSVVATPPGRNVSTAASSTLGRQFDVQGKVLRLNVVLGGASPQLRDVVLSGGARFVEKRTAQPNDKPLDITADDVQLFDADSPQSRLVITGQPATVDARGIKMTAPQIQLERGKNLLSIDHRGQVELTADRDLQGQPVKTPQRILVTWLKQMTFDGQRIRFDGDVVARTATQRLVTPTLDLIVTPRVDFSQPTGRDGETQLARIECHGRVEIESQTFAPSMPVANGAVAAAPEVTSLEWLQTHDLAVDQRTGEISATGAGLVRTVRKGFGGQLASPPGAPAARSITPSPTPPSTTANDSRLTYLQVTFQRGLAGHAQRRELTFIDQVRCIYGPVLAWDQRLEGTTREQLGPDAVTMNCDRLKLQQLDIDRTTRRAAVELEATGNVVVEGNAFTALADRMTYTEAKDLLVLEGNGRKKAELRRQTRPGAAPSKYEAGKILYWRSLPRVDIFDFALELGNLPNPKPTTPKR